MEMLKRWKAEREEKKKAELQAKKGNVFRVSKNVDRKERNLFKKSHQVSFQALYPRTTLSMALLPVDGHFE